MSTHQLTHAQCTPAHTPHTHTHTHTHKRMSMHLDAQVMQETARLVKIRHCVQVQQDSWKTSKGDLEGSAPWTALITAQTMWTSQRGSLLGAYPMENLNKGICCCYCELPCRLTAQVFLTGAHTHVHTRALKLTHTDTHAHTCTHTCMHNHTHTHIHL